MRMDRRLTFYNTLADQGNNEKLGNYISGFVDGEGSFMVTILRRKNYFTGWEVRPSFAVSQNKNRAEILFLIKDTLKCGFVRENKSDNTLKYEARSLKELVGKIIPHFIKFPLLSSRKREFELFKEICHRMQNGEHRKKDGLKEIIELSYKMNVGSKRKHQKEEILNLISLV